MTKNLNYKVNPDEKALGMFSLGSLLNAESVGR